MHTRAQLCLLPQRANDYQPYLIRRYGLVFVVLLAVGIQLLYNVRQTGSILGEKATISSEALLSEANQARRSFSLNDLEPNPKLNKAAQLKIDDMFARQYWGHDAPDGTKPWKWLAEADYSYAEAGENLAKNFYTAEATTAAWLNSTEHRDNILNPDYTEVGFAVGSGSLNGKPATLVVALYGRPSVTGVNAVGTAVAGATGSSLTFLARIGIGIQSITPAALGSIMLLLVVMIVAVTAHLYRDHIPKSKRKAFYRHHHGIIKLGGALSLAIMILLMYGGGQV